MVSSYVRVSINANHDDFISVILTFWNTAIGGVNSGAPFSIVIFVIATFVDQEKVMTIVFKLLLP
jgi:hypothetical protein